MTEHSALSPASLDATRISHLWWGFLAILAGIFVIESAAVLIALLRGGRSDEPADVVLARAAGENRSLTRWVTLSVVLSSILLVALIAWSATVGHSLGAAAPDDALHIELTGHQWWWEAVYVDKDPSQRVTVANELHVPVGRTVVFDMTSHDVIHSLWIPSLNGKRDLIPGKRTVLAITVDRPGVYRGQCAEFCGYQHAKMGITIIAEPADVFERWRAAQRTPAAEPQTDKARHGRDVFLGGPCVMCHRLSGTMALATQAPDLTHLASRGTLGAGAIANTRGNLAGWISDPQGIKPGCNMPGIALDGPELDALLDYLEVLK